VNSKKRKRCQEEKTVSGTVDFWFAIVDDLESALERFRLVAHDVGDSSARCPPSRHFCYVSSSRRTVVGSLVELVRKGSDLVNDPSVRREP
jgi:hypothetical protein